MDPLRKYNYRLCDQKESKPRNLPFSSHFENSCLKNCRRNEDGGYTDSGDIVDFAENGAESSVDQWASVSESYLDQLLTTEQVGSTRGSIASAEALNPSQQGTPFLGKLNKVELSSWDNLGLVLETPLSGSRQSLLTVESMAKTLNIGQQGRRDGPQFPVALEIHMTRYRNLVL